MARAEDLSEHYWDRKNGSVYRFLCVIFIIIIIFFCSLGDVENRFLNSSKLKREKREIKASLNHFIFVFLQNRELSSMFILLLVPVIQLKIFSLVPQCIINILHSSLFYTVLYLIYCLSTVFMNATESSWTGHCEIRLNITYILLFLIIPKRLSHVITVQLCP